MKTKLKRIPFLPIICTDCNVLALADLGGKPLCICCLFTAVGKLSAGVSLNITPLQSAE
jgi:hypothetical protein